MINFLCKSLFIFFSSWILFTLPIAAQNKICDLHIKTLSYNALPSTKNFIENVEVKIKNLKSKEEKVLSVTLENTIFENLAEGNYKVSLFKKGYKKKAKEIKLECDLADENNDLYENVYLWKDEKTPVVADGLKEYKSELSKSSDGKSDVSISNKKNGNAEKVYGKVTLQILIDEDGNVISAKALEGDEKLAEKSIRAVRKSKFLPTIMAGMAVKITGNITYNFVP